MTDVPTSRDLELLRSEVIRVLGPLLASGRVRCWLFGSRARGTAGPRSDIDLAFDGEVPSGLLGKLRAAIEESRILCHVDLVDLARASASLRDAVAREGVPWPT